MHYYAQKTFEISLCAYITQITFLFKDDTLKLVFNQWDIKVIDLHFDTFG